MWWVLDRVMFNTFCPDLDHLQVRSNVESGYLLRRLMSAWIRQD
jgi:hypothetical protein